MHTKRLGLGACALFASIALFAAGCSKSPETAPKEAPHAATEKGQVPEDVTGGALFTRQQAGFATVELRTEGELKRGENTFVALITQNNEPLTDAAVRVVLSMPDMKMYGGEIEMSHKGEGRYEGTGNLTMDGDWQANVHVASGASTGEAVFDFRVGEP